MSDERLVDIEMQIKTTEQLLASSDLDALEEAAANLELAIRTFFEDTHLLDNSELPAYQKIYDTFSLLTLKVEVKKREFAEALGNHLSTKKKLNVYKSIK
ncbi:hypothetical protein [Pseudoalteromonas sp. ASV78]|uniref:hypothetical protein n=1 Tax=Pseudoalteromonas sp. ASV78 TaxID=3397851 RepID=UPI0039FD2F24